MSEFLRKDVDAVVGRIKEFSVNTKKTGTLIQVDQMLSVAKMEDYVEPKPLNSYDFDNDLYSYLDDSIERNLFAWSKRPGLEDDLLPTIMPAFGIAEHSAFLGGEVKIEATTSYHKPFIKEWSDAKKLTLDPENTWFKRMMDCFDYLNEKSCGRYLTRLRGGCSPAELMNFIRGNDMFTDFYEYPEETHELLEFCLRAEKWFIENQKEKVKEFSGGFVSGMGVWLPGNSFGHISEDWAVMCSPDTYEQFGKPYTERMIEDYDNVLMHLHSVGTQSFSNIISMDKLTYIEISSDPNAKRAIEVYKEFSDILEKKTVIIEPTVDEIIDNADFLREQKTVIKFRAKDLEEAKRITDFVKTKIDR
jgi:hypothetical protein